MNTHALRLLLNAVFLLAVLFLPTTNVAALPANFQDTVVLSGLDTPTAMAFAPNGKIFIAEKSGIIKVFDNLQDTTPTIFADLRGEVQDYSDRGLLGLAVDPQFPARPYVYVLYTMDAPIGSTPPFYNDNCTVPDICPAGARLAKLTASGDTMISQQVLMETWCQIENSHSVGSLFFGTDGALYLSHGDGASYNYVDFGQDGGCNDPVNEGGALRSQDLRTSGDPVAYNGSLLRLNPDTGAAFAGNPLEGGANTEDDRIIAYGFRNPYRFTIDPLNGAIWVGDVGWNEWEEVDYIANPTGAVKNFGWPCYEGLLKQRGYDAADIPICENLYTAGTAQGPYYTYYHDSGNNASASGIAIYRGNNFPAAYNGALFFADYSQQWIKVMMPGTNGLPDPANIVNFISSNIFPVDIKVGPNGALYYVDIAYGTIHQISYFTLNTPPTAHATANPVSGALPLLVNFDGTGSIEPDPGDTIFYAWDLDGDGAFDDSTVAAPTFNYTLAQTVPVQLRVTDSHGASNIDSLTIYAGNRIPIPTISAPVSSTLYSVGDAIAFSGSANDPDSGLLPASALSWETILFHCSVNDATQCHEHGIQSFAGVDNGLITAPDHEYPSRIEFRLTATDPVVPSLKNTTNVTILPRTSTWTFTSDPSGLQLAVYGTLSTTPFTRTVIVNAQSTISAPLIQQLGASSYQFASWSDAGTQTHTITALSSPQTFHAVYTPTTASAAVWHSWGVVPQAGLPQGMVVSDTNLPTTVEFYESTNDFGVTKGSLFPFFTVGAHLTISTNVEAFWSAVTGADAYPYAGKSTVDRGSDAGETNAPAPVGVRDLQLHPPALTNHNTIAAFKIPQDGTYTISDIGVRRISNNGTTARLRVYNAQGTELVNLTATNNQQWVTTPTTYTLSNLTAGQYIYFGVDRDNDWAFDDTEISWTISATLSGTPPLPTCSFNLNPTTILQGANTALSWATANTTIFSIDQGLGSQASVASGSITQSPATTTTYTGTATGAGGSAQCSATVTVTTPANTPACSLSMNPTSINQGGSATLSWTSQNATSGSISPSVGSLTAANGSVSVSPTVTTTYTGNVSGAGGATNTCSTTITVTAPPPQPTCTLSVNPTPIASGGSSSLSWTSQNATALSINQSIGAVTPVASGSRSISPTVTTTYTGTVTGAGGTNTCSTTITVTVPPPQPTCTLSVNPASITSGNSSSLSWTSQNATALSINQSIGSVTPVASGSRSVSPTVTTTYTGTVTGAGGTNTCTATVTVTAPPIPTCTLSANPTSIVSGSSSSLSWTSLNATTISINQGVGSVTPVASGSRSVSPTVTTLYTATVTGAGGTNTCTRTITVTAPPPTPTCTLSANPTSIVSGSSSALSWTTQNATSLSVNQGIGSVTPVASGSRSVSPTVTTTYTGTVTGAGGTNTCTRTITVTAPPPIPTCTLSANPTSIPQGNASSLSWTSLNATGISINQGIGSVTPVASGSRSVSPTVTTLYTATVTGAGGTNTCTRTITVTAPPPVPSCTLSMNPTSIIRGNSATLSWTSQNAISGSINQGVGPLTAANGSVSVSPTVTTTYTGTANGTGGTSNTCSTTLTVSP